MGRFASLGAKALGVAVAVVLVSAPEARAQNLTLTITVNGPTGGTVGNIPGGGLCSRFGFPPPVDPTVCVRSFPPGTSVRLTANAPTGSGAPGAITAKAGSTAVCVDNTSTCTFTITENSAITVTFDNANGTSFRNMVTNYLGVGELEIGVDNSRSQNYDARQPSAPSTTYMAGSMVTIQPRPQAGSVFLGFSAGTGDATVCDGLTSCPPFALNNNSSISVTGAKLIDLSVNPATPTAFVGQTPSFTATGTFQNGATVVTSQVFASNLGLWKYRTPMPTPRLRLGAGAVGGLLYAVGGVAGATEPPSAPLNTLEAYHPGTNTWATLPNMSTGREGLGVAVRGGVLYAIGGTTPSGITNTVEAYYPESEFWAAVAPMVTPRRSFGVGVMDGKIYVVGGTSDGTAAGSLSSVEVYDPTANTWTAGPALPSARRMLAVGVVDGILYAVGGQNADGNYLTLVDALDPVAGTWTSKQALPQARAQHVVGVVDNALYVVGGRNSDGLPGSSFQSSMFLYDPAGVAGNQWFNEAFLPQEQIGPTNTQQTQLADLAGASINGIFYVVGGHSTRNSPPLAFANAAVALLLAFTDHLVWDTGIPAVASINQNGQARAVATGTTTVAARSGAIRCEDEACGQLTVAAPLAVNDSFTMPRGTTLDIDGPGVLANDTLPNFPTVEFLSAPAGFNNTGEGGFTFTPAPTFTGTVNVNYVVHTPSSGNSNTATVAITVAGPPVARADEFTILQGTTLTVPAPGLLGNDTVPDDAEVEVLAPVPAGLTTSPGGGFTFTPPATFAGTVTFRYVAHSDTIGDSRPATVRIVVTPLPVLQFSAASYSATETGARATITVKRSGSLTGTVTVDFGVFDGTATSPADYTATPGTLTFPSGTPTRTFTVNIVNDSLSERDETILLGLSAPTGGAILGTLNTALVSIRDNDPAGTLALSPSVLRVAETAGQAALTVRRTGGTVGTVTVQYATINGSAQGGSDFSITNGMLTFAPGDTAKTITVPLTNDGVAEGEESFRVVLFGATGNASLGLDRATVTITTVDTAVQFSAPTYSVSESAVQATIVVTRTGSRVLPLAVEYEASDGTAVEGTDYEPTSGSVVFPANVASKSFTVRLIRDTVYKPSRTVNLAITAPITLGTAAAVLTINDDDPKGTVSFAVADSTVSEGGGTALVTVKRTGKLAAGQSVDFWTTDGTAVAGTNYQATALTVTFAANETTRIVEIPILDDSAPGGGARSVGLSLGNGTGGAAFAPPTAATLWIVENR
jgi:hypothetical protein